jgi:hypothetical protein
MLRFLARELRSTHILLLAAYRDVDPIPGRPLIETLAEVAREPVTRRVSLGGLSEREVAQYVKLTASQIASTPLVAAVHKETEGNPLFVGEIVRLLAVEGVGSEFTAEARLAIPQSIRDVIARRLTYLSHECNRLLVLAAVVGREFALDALARLAGVSEDGLLDVLDEAMAAGVDGVLQPLGPIIRVDAPAGRRRRIIELVVPAEPERPRRLRPALGQVLIVALPPVGRQGPQAPEAADPLDHRPVLQEVGAVDVVAVAQEDVEAEPLVDPEVSREALTADRVPGHVSPTHAFGVAAEVRLRCRRCHREGDVASMQEAELGDAVGDGRTANAPGVGPTVDTLLEEEPVEDQLAAPVEQLGQ